MADITYSRTFSHEDWIDNEDVVQAGGEKGFNKKFHDIEKEFDDISQVASTIDSEIKKIQRLKFLSAESGVTVNSQQLSAEYDVEIYDRSQLPNNVEKAYHVVIFPSVTPLFVQHTLLYRQLPANNIKVTIQFYNPLGSQARFSFRVLTLSTQE